jgi:hypothetical protein
MRDYCSLARRELTLASEAFEQGFYATGRIHLKRVDWNLAEYDYLSGFIGPPRSDSTLAF